MIAYFILGFILYVAYRFVTEVVLPIWRSTKSVKQNIRNMQQNQASQPKQENQTSTQKPSSSTKKVGEYIDFEEIK